MGGVIFRFIDFMMNMFKAFIKALKPCRIEHWIILSILFYSFAGILKYYLPTILINATVSICGFGFIYLILKNIKFCPLKGFTKIVYFFLVTWTFCLTIRMLIIDDVQSTFIEYHGITTWLLAYFQSPYFIPNLMPLILLAIPRRGEFDFRYLWRVMWLMCILYLCYYPFSFWSMIHYDWSFDNVGTEWGDSGTYGDFITNSTKGISAMAPVVIMVYFKKYMPVKYWRCFLLAFVGSVLIQAFLARRGGMVTSLLYLILAWMMYSFNDKKVSKVKMIFLLALVVWGCFMLFNNMADSFFSTLVERGVEDSRSGVEEGFYADMKSTSDWMFGRGWFGQYYEPAIGEWRSSIETGYLALILRGGYFYLIPYVAILGLSFFNGYFRSKNLFCKSFAIMCLMQIVSLYPWGWPTFSFLHFVIWLGVWVCNSKRLRQLSDEQIRKIYF